MQDFVTTGFNLNFFDIQEDPTESFVGVTNEAVLPTPSVTFTDGAAGSEGLTGTAGSTGTGGSTGGGTGGGATGGGGGYG